MSNLQPTAKIQQALARYLRGHAFALSIRLVAAIILRTGRLLLISLSGFAATLSPAAPEAIPDMQAAAVQEPMADANPEQSQKPTLVPVPELAPEGSPEGAEARSPGNKVHSEITKRAQKLGDIEERLARLQQELADRQQNREVLYLELERNERTIAALASAGRQLRVMINQQHQVINDLSVRLEQTRLDLRVAQEDLEELLRSAYAMGRGDRLRMLLNRDDLSRSGRVFGYYRCLSRARAERIDTAKRLADKLSALRSDAERETLRLQRLAERQAETRSRLQSAGTQRQAIVASLDATIADGIGEVAALNAQAQSLRELIERLRRTLQIAAEIDLNQVDIASQKGKLAWPITKARLTTHFNQIEGGNELHADGVLIAADEGSEVHAVHHGRVIYADWLRGFGLLLVIDHGDGYMSLYGHNQTLLKEVGEWIDTGEIIALTGASGGSGSLGLYFALRYQGKPLNPERWCRQTRG